MSTALNRYFALLKLPKILILGLLLAYLVYAYMTANSPGYCKAQKRVISNKEICAKLFDDEISKGHLQLGASEKNGQDYFINHPRYCAVDRGDVNEFRLGGVFSDFFDNGLEVDLKYKMTSDGKKYWKSYGSEAYTLWGSHMLLTSCGQVMRSNVDTEMMD